MLRRFFWTSAIAALLVAVGAVPAALADDAVCQEFPKAQRIGTLGGPQAFSKTAVRSPGDALEKLKAHRAELEALFAARGVGHLLDPIMKAVESGQGLSERNLERGETFEWMIFRKTSGPVAAGPFCYAAKKTFDAYEVVVTEETSKSGTARCEISAKCTTADQEMSVDASGSSPGVEVTVSGPGGTKKVVSGGATSWKGLPDAPGDYTFTATAQVQGTKTVTTHTFIIPKVCFNVAYLGQETREVEGAADTCRKEAKVTCEDPKPNCELVAPAQVTAREPFSVDATGRYDSIEVRANEAVLRDEAGKRLDSFQPPKTLIIRKPGTYTLEGTATNPAGTATCTASIEVLPPPFSPWTFRGFALTLDTDDDEIYVNRFRPDGVNERSGLTIDGGYGLGVGLERHLNPRIGIEASLLWADLDSLFILDLDEAWGHDDDAVTFLAITIGPNFHLTPGKRVDFYLGPFVGWADLGNTTYQVLGETHQGNFGSEFVLGGQLGLDVGFGGDLGLHLGIRYIDLTAGDDDSEIDVNPLIGEAGLFYRF